MQISTFSTIFIYTQQKSYGNLRKNMQYKNIKANNYLIFIYLFRYMSSVEKNVYFSLLAPKLLLWHSGKNDYRVLPQQHMKNM